MLNLGDARVDAGAGGTWLLDPTDLTIDTAAAAIDTALGNNTSVTEQTTASGSTDGSGAGATAPGAGDIDIDAAISWSTGATLTLSAYNNVNVNAAITASGAGSLTIATGNSVGGTSSAGTALNFTGGAISFTGTGGALTINGHPYTLIQSMGGLSAVGSSGFTRWLRTSPRAPPIPRR